MKSLMLLAMGVLFAVLLIWGCGSDDKGTNPVTPVPQALQRTWWYHSASMNGIPYASFEPVSHTDTSETGSVKINSNHTWRIEEFHTDQVVYSENGTLVIKDDTLITYTTHVKDQPASEIDTSIQHWEVIGDTLITSNTFTINNQTYGVIAKYLAE